jgi:hypothetical protein
MKKEKCMVSNFNKISCILGFIALSITVSAHAETDKSKSCPLLNQIRFSESRLVAYNSDEAFFASGAPCSFCDDIYTMKPLSFHPELTRYNDTDKSLMCIYKVDVTYSDERRTKTELKSLVNYGDY